MTLDQLPSAVSSPDVVLLRCRFNLTESQLLSVIWSKGIHQESIYSQSKTSAQAADGFEDIVVGDESQLTLSQDFSMDWSEATLTMRVNYCLRDTYHCLVTDSRTLQSSRSVELTFKGE